MKEKVAIIGGGVAGLTAGYLLSGRHEVTLFEKEGRIGGNAYTLATSDGNKIDVSIFFFNTLSYPNFFRLLSRLGIEITTPRLAGAGMTLHNLDTNETRRFNLDPWEGWGLDRFNPKSAAILVNLVANLAGSLRLLESGAFQGLTMAEALKLLPGLKGDAYKLMIFPLCLMASMHHRELMEAPASHFMGKLEQHFGSINKATSWRLLNCRTDDYIQSLSKNYQDRIMLNARISSVARSETGVTIKMSDGSQSSFDRAVFACYADQALKMLERPTDDEQRILGAWRYNDGLVVVHRDGSRFPSPNRMCLYEYLYTDRDGELETSINAAYRFQKGVSDKCACLGTQYPNFPIRDDLIEFKQVFRTPIYDHVSTSAIKELPRLNGVMRSYYCGSHFGYGLHEDAVASAIEAARMLGAVWD